LEWLRRGMILMDDSAKPSTTRTALWFAASLLVGATLSVAGLYSVEGKLNWRVWGIVGAVFILAAAISAMTWWAINRRGAEDRPQRALRVVSIGSSVLVAIAVVALIIKLARVLLF
jgi:hypothetical protein